LQPELEADVEIPEPHAGLAKLVVDHLSYAGTLLHEDDRLLLQLVERDRAAREPVPARHREDDLVAEERLEDDAALPSHRADNAELELAPGDLLDHALRVRHRQRNLHGGMQPLELRERDRQHRPSRSRRRADLKPARELALDLFSELGQELLLRGKQPLRAPVEPAAGLGRLDPSSRPVDELDAEPLLERPDLQAHRRLRDPKLLRRLREAPPLDDRAERSELPRIHKQRLCLDIRSGGSSIPVIEDTFIRGYRQLALETPARRRDVLLRALDLTLSAVFLLCALPVALVIALVVLLTSGSPVFYRGERVGRGGRVFTMLKFRTLRSDAESRLGPYLGEELVRRTEAEFTPVGKWLKATQLDEIPQFINVLRGDMSLVGPRPIRPVFFEELAHDLPAYWQRLIVRPGLTGLAQVRRGYETSMAEKLAHDLEWIADRSVRLYLRTVVATGWRVMKQSLRGLVSRSD
jgi:lipopolysaccharide/colanic/teichoic acid biosynthesis glycosyltransferase